jgi:hypothetical protein
LGNQARKRSTTQILFLAEHRRETKGYLAKEIVMLLFYLPMILFGAMFDNNSNDRATRATHPDDMQ